jgi:hypothetical protein
MPADNSQSAKTQRLKSKTLASFKIQNPTNGKSPDCSAYRDTTVGKQPFTTHTLIVTTDNEICTLRPR